ncbi:MAG: TetR/AcrR family transcriptional regulator [Acidobacteriota bacterium]|nr:TetR/AcrR family transcriptional regulator [Acidobacteriota bacterium]
MTRRSQQEEETKLRIAASTMELHGTVGPARTTISAVAEHAGVRRATVYRHYPDELALFTGCSSLWLANNPLPDMGRWAAIKDVNVRLRTALDELYAFYRRTHAMLTNLFRDEEAVPALKLVFAAFRQYMAAAQQLVQQDRQPSKTSKSQVNAVIGHALSFFTWRSFALEQGLDNESIRELMVRLVDTAENLKR